MKINIIGPTGSGKTFLAEKLSQKLKIPQVSLDYVLFKHTRDKHREELPENEWRANLLKLLGEKDWIIEGVNPIIEVFETADMIIYLRPSISTALFRQWKRYFTDPKQKKEHGFKNNLKLSQYLIRQYQQHEDKGKEDDPKYSRVKKLDRILKKYKEKVVWL